MERDRLKTLKGLQDQRSELVERATDGSTNAFTSRHLSGFRFGSGAMGSVIGEQNETKTTNELLRKSLTKLDMQIVELRKLTDDPTAPGNAFPH
jgi:hypothetical protein